MILGGERRSLNGGDKCGDAFAWWRDRDCWTIVLVDGLGHGPEAALAADAALLHAEESAFLSPRRMIETIDDGIRGSRGAAIGVAQIDAARRTLSWFGVGNVRAALFGEKTQRFEGTPGIVGTGCRTPLVEVLPFADGDLLVLWTDGSRSNLTLDQASKRLKGDPEALARRLVDRFSTGRDDAGVVCCLLEGASP